MHLKNKKECLDAIEDWKRFSLEGQTINLKKSIESLELDQMYYQGKGSEKASERCARCLEILNKRLDEIDAA